VAAVQWFVGKNGTVAAGSFALAAVNTTHRQEDCTRQRRVPHRVAWVSVRAAIPNQRLYVAAEQHLYDGHPAVEVPAELQEQEHHVACQHLVPGLVPWVQLPGAPSP
jgi:hypothetical protein